MNNWTLNKFSADEPLTITIKKSTEMYVVGGVAEDEDEGLVFWYAIRTYPAMSKYLREETGTKSKSEYIQKYRPDWERGEAPPEYVEFYKDLPGVFEEGSPHQIERAKPERLKPAQIIVEPTIVEYNVKPTGDVDEDVPVVEEIIKKIRELIWQYPVTGKFTSLTGLQGSQLQQFINNNLKKASRAIRMRKFAQHLRILPEMTRYIAVATGEIFSTEDAVKHAIEEYHNNAAPMAAAASNKGGTLMNKIGELLKVADMLDEQGDFESADELMNIIKDMADEQPNEPIKEQISDVEEKKAWVNEVVTTLVKVADSLEDRGAIGEAQMADELLVDLKQDLPQAFNFGHQPQITEPMVQDFSPSAPVQNDIPMQGDVPEVEGTPFQNLPDTSTLIPEVEVEVDLEPEDTGPPTPEIEQVEEPEGQFDELTLDEFQNVIDSLQHRYSQGPKRQKYEEIFGVAQKAQDYYNAYKEWHDYAHKLFDDEPIRLKIE